MINPKSCGIYTLYIYFSKWDLIILNCISGFLAKYLYPWLAYFHSASVVQSVGGLCWVASPTSISKTPAATTAGFTSSMGFPPFIPSSSSNMTPSPKSLAVHPFPSRPAWHHPLLSLPPCPAASDSNCFIDIDWHGKNGEAASCTSREQGAGPRAEAVKEASAKSSQRQTALPNANFNPNSWYLLLIPSRISYPPFAKLKNEQKISISFWWIAFTGRPVSLPLFLHFLAFPRSFSVSHSLLFFRHCLPL